MRIYQPNKFFILFAGFLLALQFCSPVHAQTTPDSVVTIRMDALIGLQFNVVRFGVKPGARVKIVFSNSDDMSHNLLITKPGTRLEVVNAALKLGEDGPRINYVPKMEQVLWAIPVVVPDQTQTLTFKAPQTPGVYPYVCTFPGHGFVMYGAMYVSPDAKLPPISTDENIPPTRRKEQPTASAKATGHKGHAPTIPQPWHPYPTVAPYFYRVYIKDASPAAIAVCLPHELAYTWDAGTCRLRYAWSGGFLDNSDLWKGKGDAEAKITGTVFFRDKTDFPITLDKEATVPVVQYKGYKLLDRYPEFRYTLNGTEVYELIKPKPDGSGLIRSFRLPKVKQKIWFNIHPEDGVTYQASAGKWEQGKLRLTPRQARAFTITMTRKDDVKL